MLESEVVELHIVDRASDSTIGRALKKHSSAPSPTVLGHPAQGQQRVRSGDGRRAGRLHAATRSHRPLLCLDETSKQLLAETRATIPMKPGRPARCGYEYERMSAMGPPTSSCCSRRSKAGATSIALAFPDFRDIGLQQDPSLQQRCAGLFPFRIRASSRSRSSALNRTTYFFT